MQHC